MKLRLKSNLMVVTGESAEEIKDIAEWATRLDGHVFALKLQDDQTCRLTNLGSRPEACQEPINVTSLSPDPDIQLISNLAHTPFDLNGQRYGSVEAFWQGLKFSDDSRRTGIASLYGQEARRAGFDAPEADATSYRGQVVRVGTAEHWRLMADACWAKFSQHEAARQALLGTGERPLAHKTRRDSRNIPGVIMADIWMKIRRGLVKRIAPEDEPADEEERQ
jgi:predicted NAD-dependent protein-ADP-ribosyltransferase YbiA (DUF1768 family)